VVERCVPDGVKIRKSITEEEEEALQGFPLLPPLLVVEEQLKIAPELLAQALIQVVLGGEEAIMEVVAACREAQWVQVGVVLVTLVAASLLPLLIQQQARLAFLQAKLPLSTWPTSHTSKALG